MGYIIVIIDFFEKLTGISKLRNISAEIKKDAYEMVAAAKAEAEKAKAEVEAAKAEAEKIKNSAITDKEQATIAGKPWVNVSKTHLGESVRHGYFELDWNDIFVNELRKAGYGKSTDPDEAVVDLWFKELCASVVVESDYQFGPIEAGSINPEILKTSI